MGIEGEGNYRGKAAINVVDPSLKGQGRKVANNNPTPFAKVDSIGTRPFIRRLANGIVNKDRNGVIVSRMYRMSGPAWNVLYNNKIWKMPDHSHLGRMTYGKVGNLDVYFGEWADVKAGAGAGTVGTNTSVFYNGTGKTTRMPTSGKATYAVKGINNYVNQNSPIMIGTLTADFGAKKLNGTIAKTGLSVAINNATINTAQASFDGAAKANGVIGKTHGNFYGNNAAALAGVADFNNPKLNTAFGGTRR
ncbi:hypothetical protein HMPREF9016_00958 [Neisseria sp. oral taxon 014 str. F0314]|nr:hypothetical protein HMPREF9016_00958 [Neisseria sp. oral taxon 014 str. F0314]